MIDWHSHILPGIDDGSKNLAESLALLNAQKAQGIKTVVATPHFYANDEEVDVFLQRRNEANELMQKELPMNYPEIKLGAEVRYYPGISRLEGIKKLRIDGSKLLLLEMPLSTWTEYMVRELIEMAGRSSIRIAFAHFERYLRLQKLDTWERIYESGILLQANSSFFTSFSTKRKAISLLKNGNIQFIGSDCHDMKFRPPKIGEAFKIIQKRLGDDYLTQMNEYGYSMLETTKQ